MPRITIEMLRRRSEHNEGEIHSLEELSLHQENIEKIEFLNQACRKVKILLLQNNLISKIENLYKLKDLQYLNLALNNIEVIENLERCESLQKLDLTVNFIGDIRGVKSLRYNEHLEQLILTGNPCCEYEGYREYVIATLPQLRELDMKEIDRTERIKALQQYAEAQGDVIRGYRNYLKLREKQKNEFQQRVSERSSVKIKDITDGEDTEKKENEDEDSDDEFWKEKSYHTPEDRMLIAQKSMALKEKHENSKDSTKNKKTEKKVVKLFHPDGKAYNMNQPQIPFKLDDESSRDDIILEVHVYKHLDTSYVDVDVQPTYVRVTIKGKILQLTLSGEVAVDKSKATRNTTTGSLLIIMPRVDKLEKIFAPLEDPSKKKKNVVTVRAEPEVTKREFLEIGPPKKEIDEMLQIVENNKKKKSEQPKKTREPDPNFVDDPEVPPLE